MVPEKDLAIWVKEARTNLHYQAPEDLHLLFPVIFLLLHFLYSSLYGHCHHPLGDMIVVLTRFP